MVMHPEPEIETTRDKLLACAEKSILRKGFAATSIEELIDAVGITKSGFFYHFRDKGEMAKALLDRYLENEEQWFDAMFKRADELNEDPLHGFLVFLKMFVEAMEDLPGTHPGCLIATYCYEERLFDDDVRQKTATSLLNWRRRFRSRLDLIVEKYPPRIDVDLDGPLPLLPLKKEVLFPGSVAPLAVGRDTSVALVQAVEGREQAVILAFAQRDPEVDEPGFGGPPSHWGCRACTQDAQPWVRQILRADADADSRY